MDPNAVSFEQVFAPGPIPVGTDGVGTLFVSSW